MAVAEGRLVRRAPARASSEYLFASREWIRLLAVVGALIADTACLLLAFSFAPHVRFETLVPQSTWQLLWLVLPAYLLACVTFDAYGLEVLRRRERSVLRSQLALVTAVAVALASGLALGAVDHLLRLETGFALLMAAVFLAFGRVAGSAGLAQLRGAIEPTVFVLCDATAPAYAEHAHRVVNVRSKLWQPMADDPDFLDLFCRTFRHADRVLLIFGDSRERAAWAGFMRLTGLNAELVEPQLGSIVPSGIDAWRGHSTLVVSRRPLTLPERVVKRGLDLTLTILAAPVAIPLAAILALLIKLESPGPCLFVQERVGRKNVRYRCLKLRTMRADAVDPNGMRSASRDDDRITSVGRFLRRTSLDELPQLWNVFVGNMSFVGPRPHALGSTAEGKFFWQVAPSYWSRHAVKPGLTGLAQIRGLRGATSNCGDLEQRLAADLEYLNSWSIWLDIKILLRTPFVMMHRNAF